MERIRNVIKRDRTKGVQIDETQNAKRPKKQKNLLSRYPVTIAPASTGDNDREDAESIQGHIDSMQTEMEKQKPRNTLLKRLMKFTYTTRRDSILGGLTVAAALETYPALKRPDVVSSFTLLSINLNLLQVEQEMTMILDKADVKSSFVTKWTENYTPSILEYASNSRKKTIRNLMKDIVYDEEG